MLDLRVCCVWIWFLLGCHAVPCDERRPKGGCEQGPAKEDMERKGMEMDLRPAGEGMMGDLLVNPCSAGEVYIPPAMGVKLGSTDPALKNPEHTVNFTEGFCMDEAEVTVAEYRACGGCSEKPEARTGTGAAKHCNWTAQSSGREEHPVNCLKHAGAQQYCKIKMKFLPTDDQWEYAARGTSMATYAWGMEPMPDDKTCWNRMNIGTCAAKDSSYRRTSLGAEDKAGLFNMTGNVWEMTTLADVVRGGGWWTWDEAMIKAAFRRDVQLNEQPTDVGFRCVRPLP